jgi:hypothetical protein
MRITTLTKPKGGVTSRKNLRNALPARASPAAELRCNRADRERAPAFVGSNPPPRWRCLSAWGMGG